MGELLRRGQERTPQESVSEKFIACAREAAQWLRLLLQRAPGSVCSTYKAVHNHPQLQNWGDSSALFRLPLGAWHAHGAPAYTHVKLR